MKPSRKTKRANRVGSGAVLGVCEHSEMPNLPYIEHHSDAQIRMKSGEKQKFCINCGKYVWASYWLRSNCCDALMAVSGGSEGTRWHECKKCGGACDGHTPNDPSSPTVARRWTP